MDSICAQGMLKVLPLRRKEDTGTRLLFKTPGGGVPRHPDFLGHPPPPEGGSRRGQALFAFFLSSCIKTVQKLSDCAGHLGHFGTPGGVPKLKRSLTGTKVVDCLAIAQSASTKSFLANALAPGEQGTHVNNPSCGTAWM